MVVETDPATCSSQFDPTGTASSPAPATLPRARSSRAASPIRHARQPMADPRPGWRTRRSPVAGGEGLTAPDLKARKAETGGGDQGRAGGRRLSPSPPIPAIQHADADRVLLLFVVAATALYGPQAAALVEMFPTRIRYTAMSLPYHVGTGWVGGFLPVTSFAIVAITGDIYAGLWYPVVFTALSAW